MAPTLGSKERKAEAVKSIKKIERASILIQGARDCLNNALDLRVLDMEPRGEINSIIERLEVLIIHSRTCKEEFFV